MRKPRRVFGGNTGTGIWWRKRRLPDELDPVAAGAAAVTTADPAGIVTAPEEGPATTTGAGPGSGGIISDDEVLIGWDDDLCRPIYRHHNGGSKGGTFGCEEEGGEEEGGDAECETLQHERDDGTKRDRNSMPNEGDTPDMRPLPLQPPAESMAKQKRRATKTFANRHQRPLTLIHLMMQGGFLGSPSSTEGTDEIVSATPPSKRSRIIEAPALSTLGSGETLQQLPSPRRVSVPSLRGTVRAGSSSKTHSAVNGPDGLFDFEFDGGPRQTPSSSVANSHASLERARDYFAHLDRTQALTLDASSSPPVSSKITRTSRRADLSSPRFTKEYRAYAEASVASGVPPLSVQDYSSSRRLHFRKKELFDGFLDG